ncbi:RadC family protein [Desulfogranum japonicum]|uniref:RadC family protein n=1 Tax=Desulfogranum japonicum TaxID=231447 RepID=UPI000421E057|nr:DNA repair protein RadC [Desulfogranum japonicum]
MDKQQWQNKGKGHRQRLRDKFLHQGIDAFSDAEIIELLLTFGTPRSDCKESAREALRHFGSLPAVLDASPGALQQIKGLGAKNIFALNFIQGVARRYLRQRIQGKDYLRSSRDVAEYLIHSMRGLEKEVFTVIFLDNAHAVIDTRVVAEGTINVNTIYPRELIKEALACNACALIIAHNHPSGNLTPSAQDKELTLSLYLVCSFMHINLLDHLIIGKGEQVYSFADHGIMASIQEQSRAVRAQLT